MALSAGLFASSLSGNQIVSAVVGMAVLLTLSFIDQVGDLLSGTAAQVIENLSINAHFTDFTRGVVDFSHVIYFISLTAVFLFLTVRSLETRRWR